jgi:lysine 2,3-aminomutase
MIDRKKRDWDTWDWQINNSESYNIPCRETADIFPVAVTPYYASLIEKSDIPDDPIYRQAFPDKKELCTKKSENLDPLNEDTQMPVPKLIHRYKNRVVMLTTNRCAVHCRFCLRKRKWKKGVSISSITDSELQTILEYIKEHKEINEVLVSGGDPLMLQDSQLKKILNSLSEIPTIRIIRLGTRIPVVMPMRIDAKLADMLADIPGLWVATHFNHPREVTRESLSACSKLQKRGIPILNQTVLLKGINDNKETLIELFRSLAANRIKPHYLFHIDPVAGNSHFATGLQKGIELMREFRNSLSSIETPLFAFDLQEGGGKIPLLPNYSKNGKFETLDGDYIAYPY